MGCGGVGVWGSGADADNPGDGGGEAGGGDADGLSEHVGEEVPGEDEEGGGANGGNGEESDGLEGACGPCVAHAEGGDEVGDVGGLLGVASGEDGGPVAFGSLAVGEDVVEPEEVIGGEREGAGGDGEGPRPDHDPGDGAAVEAGAFEDVEGDEDHDDCEGAAGPPGGVRSGGGEGAGEERGGGEDEALDEGGGEVFAGAPGGDLEGGGEAVHDAEGEEEAVDEDGAAGVAPFAGEDEFFDGVHEGAEHDAGDGPQEHEPGEGAEGGGAEAVGLVLEALEDGHEDELHVVGEEDADLGGHLEGPVDVPLDGVGGGGGHAAEGAEGGLEDEVGALVEEEVGHGPEDEVASFAEGGAPGLEFGGPPPRFVAGEPPAHEALGGGGGDGGPDKAHGAGAGEGEADLPALADDGGDHHDPAGGAEAQVEADLGGEDGAGGAQGEGQDKDPDHVADLGPVVVEGDEGREEGDEGGGPEVEDGGEPEDASGEGGVVVLAALDEEVLDAGVLADGEELGAGGGHGEEGEVLGDEDEPEEDLGGEGGAFGEDGGEHHPEGAQARGDGEAPVAFGPGVRGVCGRWCVVAGWGHRVEVRAGGAR